MGRFIKSLFWIFIGLFLLSGFFRLLGVLFKLTFGIIGVIMGFIWKFVLVPLLVILIIAWLVGKLQKKSSSH